MKNRIKEGINRRFFVAIDDLVCNKKVASLNAFCLDNGLIPSRFRECRLEYGPEGKPGKSRYEFIGIESLYYLASKYRVSSKWLITGKGPMYETFS